MKNCPSDIAEEESPVDRRINLQPVANLRERGGSIANTPRTPPVEACADVEAQALPTQYSSERRGQPRPRQLLPNLPRRTYRPGENPCVRVTPIPRRFRLRRKRLLNRQVQHVEIPSIVTSIKASYCP